MSTIKSILPVSDPADHSLRVPLELLRDLVNTRQILRNAPHAREDLGSPQALDQWWRRHAGWLWSEPSGAGELAAYLTVREGFRGLLARHNDCRLEADGPALARFDTMTAALPMRVSMDASGQPQLRSMTTGNASEGLVALLAAMLRAEADGHWQRLKICRDPDCREAFVDTSRNNSRAWCSMEVCGSRAKQRAFAARRRGQGQDQGRKNSGQTT